MATTMESEMMTDPMVEEVTREELDYIRKLRERVSARQLTPYRRALIERAMQRKRGRKVEGPDKLPGGGYVTYRLARGGKHRRYELKDQVAYAKLYAEQLAEHIRLRAAGVNTSPPQLANPDVTEYKFGDLVTPQDDIEALIMDQDPGKFIPQGQEGGSGGATIDELTAELNRYRTEAQRLAAVDEENAKMRAELEKLKKKDK